jgi:hypothetical protein
MRKLIYLVFNNGWVHASFTRHGHFNPERWREKNVNLLREMGVAKVEFEEVADDFYLPWEHGR